MARILRKVQGDAGAWRRLRGAGRPLRASWDSGPPVARSARSRPADEPRQPGPRRGLGRRQQADGGAGFLTQVWRDPRLRRDVHCEQHVYRAVALDRVISHCGFDEGPGGRCIAPTGRSPGVGRTCGFLRGLPVCRLEEFGRVDREQTGRGPLQGTSGREAGELPDAGLWAA